MTANQLINLLAAITLVEMMVTIGLGVTFANVAGVAKRRGLVMRAALANYIFVPALAVALLLWFSPCPMVAAGFLLVAVCPGAPYGPPFTALAKGNVVASVGLMVILAGSSAILAPLLLQFLLPLVTGDTLLTLNVTRMIGTLLGAQLLPLCVGLWLRHRYPVLAERLKKPANQLSALLNLTTFTVIVMVQLRMLREIRVAGYVGMLSLLLATIAAGWLLGGRVRENRKGMVLTTSVRNVGVGLVIASSSFPGTAAITSATAYALFQTIVMALVALAWGRIKPAGICIVKKQAA